MYIAVQKMGVTSWDLAEPVGFELRRFRRFPPITSKTGPSGIQNRRFRHQSVQLFHSIWPQLWSKLWSTSHCLFQSDFTHLLTISLQQSNDVNLVRLLLLFCCKFNEHLSFLSSLRYKRPGKSGQKKSLGVCRGLVVFICIWYRSYHRSHKALHITGDQVLFTVRYNKEWPVLHVFHIPFRIHICWFRFNKWFNKCYSTYHYS